ncbi:uncharacterized protein PFL1_05636 [Pseudozyma flocculosa PF-1]|uniref:Peptide hydrolase n=2 Tax=Pseudozyma flocculosa TaxID=84751 RepID=A0A5C3FFQ4_9BASI|nr:uncharacterized protein PFL1_05636 [Pseudozyma flocculosa PF-1]EPQ26656.1 hypothetical protein PFL1_05636 [Pseudozyma flocculosa PF-1]SPO42179.1 uncharacterized protein PSFLO_07662 [Pseudozyma flocculosa]
MPPKKARPAKAGPKPSTTPAGAPPTATATATTAATATSAGTRADGSAAAAEAAARIIADREASEVDPVNYRRTPKSPLFALLLAALVALLASTTLYLHYRLPAPKPSTAIIAAGLDPELATAYDPRSPVAALDQRSASARGGDPVALSSHFSEANAVSVMHHLSVGIGYRIVGTKQHVEAEDWLEEILRRYEGWHDTGLAGTGTRTQVEVWKQLGDGAHRFDFMGSTVWKKYYSMSNLVVRLSDGTNEGKANALLLNAHLDSTLPSPGGADDGIGVSILLEALRALTLPNTGRRLHNSVVLLFNNGEESLQDASHLYITQHHPTKDTVRAVVNLEACGTSGPELLFQATSTEMIEAYSKVPHPFGTVLANDVFSTGLILSDTDFRQFVEYGNHLTGLDMALVGSSYLYHTRKDVPAHLEPGATQHFGENVLAILEHLCLDPNASAKLASIQPRQSRASLPIYFTLAGRKFFLISSKAFKSIVMGISAIVNFQMSAVTRAESHLNALNLTMLSVLGTVVSLLAAVVGANAVALLMVHVLGRGMSWFSHEWAAVALYGPPALASVLAVQYAMSHLVKPHQRPYFERATMTGMQIVFVLVLLGLNAFSIGSAYLMILAAGTLLLSTTINDFVLVGFGNIEMRQVAPDMRVSPWTYVALVLVPSSVGFEGMASFLDLFVPLTGRMGEVSPADNIIATIVAALSFLSLPALVPLSHRYTTATLGRAILALVSLTAVMVAVFAARQPFDALHPKRLFVHQVQNITSGEWFMNLGAADPAPGFEQLSNDVQRVLGRPGESAVLHEMNAQNTDFDILYPVSDFLTPYKFQLPGPAPAADGGGSVTPYAAPAPASQHFTLRAVDEVVDFDRATRSVTLEIQHPGMIWPVIAFDGDVVEWNLPSTPPSGHRRHHIKQVGRHGQSKWSVDLVLRLDADGLAAARARKTGQDFGQLVTTDPGVGGGAVDATRSDLRDPSRLWIDMSGLVVDGMFPQHRHEAKGRYAMDNFEKMDAYLAQEHPEVDAMLLSVVAAVVVA